MKLPPAQLRVLQAVAEGHVHIRYGDASRNYRRHDDGGYSWNTMGAVCTVQIDVLRSKGLIEAGPIVDNHGLKSRKWITTEDGDLVLGKVKK